MKTKKQKFKISFVVFGFFIVAGVLGFGESVKAQTKVLDYGFEDWSGDAGTTPEYIFSTSDYSTYWVSHHCNSTEVISICESNSAYEGSYFFHRNFYTGAFDSCLGTTPGSSNARCNIGAGLQYPDNGYGNKIKLRDVITSETLVIRFYFRTTGTWKGQTATGGGSLGNLKFIRLYGTGGGGDSGGCFVHLDANNANGNRFMILDYNDGSSGLEWYYYDSATDFTNGNWHSMTIKVIRLNTTNTNPNLNVSVWINDWDMSGSAEGSHDVWYSTWGTQFDYFVMQSNFSGTSPAGSMGIDLDKIEVWDGLPNAVNIHKNKKNKISIYPNPFKETSTIEYDLPKASDVSITLHNSQGQKVKTIINSFNYAGKHKAILNANDLPAGIYYYKINACGSIQTKKCMLMK